MMTNLLQIKESDKREDCQFLFDKIAKAILSKFELRTPRNSYIIREIEFYYHSINHPDCYCHRNDRQLLNSSFYFHRFKDPAKYLNLKQKGIDITFGDRKENYGGILIRAIQNINTREIIKGIGILTNQIIEEIGGTDKIVNLYEKNLDIFDQTTNLHLFPCTENKLRIFRKNRQGLNLMKEDKDGFFFHAAYNYFTYPEISELL